MYEGLTGELRRNDRRAPKRPHGPRAQSAWAESAVKNQNSNGLFHTVTYGSATNLFPEAETAPRE
jgi:hypothetical protein